jgi:hypothetical protein
MRTYAHMHGYGHVGTQERHMMHAAACPRSVPVGTCISYPNRYICCAYIYIYIYIHTHTRHPNRYMNIFVHKRTHIHNQDGLIMRMHSQGVLLWRHGLRKWQVEAGPCCTCSSPCNKVTYPSCMYKNIIYVSRCSKIKITCQISTLIEARQFPRNAEAFIQ